MRRRILVARIAAVVADAVQLGLVPLFAPGFASVFDMVLDGAMAVAMIALVGWHWAFVPAFLAELVPVVDLAPTWTIAVLLATRSSTSEVVPVSPTRGEGVSAPPPPRLPPPR